MEDELINMKRTWDKEISESATAGIEPMTMFDHISKHLEVRLKYTAMRRIFNSLLGVWKCRQTRPFKFNTFPKAGPSINF